jgi:two-component system nitrogen regulation response regulator NtrX
MLRILIVDDEHEIRSTLSAALGRRGFRVETAINIEGARKMPFGKYDVILLDVMLPDGNGVDLLQEIMKEPDHPPVVMMSGVAGIDAAVKSIQVGAVDFLEKPLSLDRVLLTINNILKAENLKEENRALSQIIYGSFIGDSPDIKKIKKA